MSTNDSFQADPNITQLSADPNVRVPDHVKAAAAAAEAMHKQIYEAPPSRPEPAAAPEPTAAATPTAQELAARAGADPGNQPDAAAAAAEQHSATPAAEQNVSADEWRHRFLSMQGRYNAQVRSNAGMEEQMRQMGAELIRTQEMLANIQGVTSQQPAHAQSHGNLITEQDRENYGDELIELARRAARETLTPELEQLRADNQRLNQRVQVTSKRELFAALDAQIPNWRGLNVSPQFKGWLRLPNVYTGQIRGNMLKAAVDGAEAPKVIALFKDFLAEAAATGQQASAAQVEQQTQQIAPRTPAVSLETLASPGRARPASGDSQVPSEKPIYSRADITRFYDEKRRGLWAHRAAEAQAFENDLTAAQREGRIR